MLLERLKAGKRNIKVIKYPGTDQDIAIQVLSNAERQAAHFAAEHYFKLNKIEASLVTVDAYETEKTIQMLFLALKDASDKTASITKTADELRNLLTLEEKDILVEEYNAFEKECSPVTVEISDAELDALMESVKKNAATAMNVSSITIARKLIVSLVSRLQKQPKDSGSISS